MKAHSLLIAAALSVAAMSATSCSVFSSKRTPEEVRADSIANSVMQSLIENRSFMMLGDRISSNRSRTMTVIPNSNFILVEGDDAYIQISPGVAFGPNGVGGFTFRGKVSFYEVKHKKNGDLVTTFVFSSNSGRSGDVTLVLYSGGTNASASINSTFYKGKLQMTGKITIPDRDKIMMGSHR